MPLEVCPISNVRTGVVPNLESHPIQKYFEEGLLVSINSDDPKMFDTSLENEFTELMETFDFELPDVKKLIANGIRSAWCDEVTKKGLLDELQKA